MIIPVWSTDKIVYLISSFDKEFCLGFVAHVNIPQLS